MRKLMKKLSKRQSIASRVLCFEKPDDWNIPAFNYWNESDVEVDNGDAERWKSGRVNQDLLC